MIADIERGMQDYWAWLKQRTTLRELNHAVEITTPFLDRHNDYLQLYVVTEGDRLRITDDSYTLEDLESTGCNLDSTKRKALLQTTLNGFGVQQEGNELFVHANPISFGRQKHNLIQAVLAVNDLFYLAQPIVANLFREQVSDWLDEHDIRFSPDVRFFGKSGYDFNFDFLIPKSRNAPERLLRAINRPDKNNAQITILAWEDTKHARPQDSQAFVFLNDIDNAVHAPVLDAFENYQIEAVPWSKRENVVGQLAA